MPEADRRGSAARGGGPGGFGGPGGGGRGGFGGPGGGPPQPGQILPRMLRQRLALTAEQEKQVDALQKEVDAKLDKILTSEQKQQLKQMRERGPGGFGPGGPPPGAGSARLLMATARLPAEAAGRAAMALRHRPMNRK